MIIWKEIKGFENYSVSNYGEVKSNKKDIILKQRKTKTGYKIVDMRANKKKYTKYVHRLVAEAFVDNEFNFKCVNHKDENKENNNYLNLEWCTVKYNNSYGSRLLKLSESAKGRKATIETREKLSKLRKGENHWNYGNTSDDETKNKNMLSQKNRKRIKNIETGDIYESVREASRVTGINYTSLKDCVAGKQNKAGGYRWEVV